MAQVTATAEITIAASPEEVLAALADYATVRPAILTDAYTDYAVTEGGVGTGTVATWRLHTTEKRIRHVVADVVADASTVTEKDRNSSMVTVFAVSPAVSGSQVVVTTTWDGAGGVGGFFERTFAPKGLRRIHDGLLANLAARLAG
ncbi:MAG: SRPBCC family protein [Nocardioidaceae bacterium]|nr:SRPBCC family protein [Nocardioidaceae bacterium]MCL2613122.1 SRPBCC family protein [Nocardioidaceae bacterium]